jgi:hypothetical protein
VLSLQVADKGGANIHFLFFQKSQHAFPSPAALAFIQNMNARFSERVSTHRKKSSS